MTRTALWRAEDGLIVGSMGLTLAGLIVAAILATPVVFGMTALVVVAVLLLGWSVIRGAYLAWLLPFGLVAGILELWSDWVHVRYIHSLVYTAYFGFHLLASPSYMPLGWWITVIQFGYLALRLRERWSAPRVVGGLTVLGLCLPPWYEELAAHAGAWRYPPHGPMLGHTPLWIVGTYGGCVCTIATTALLLYRPRAWDRALLGGVCTGAGLMLSSVVCFAVLGRGL